MANINNILSENLKTIRIEKGLSQQELSSLSGVQRSQISRIEKGNVNPTASTINSLAEALKIELPDLFREEKKYKIHPFVKWAGGKTQLLDTLMNNLPENFKNYYEPFIGGGALLMKLQPKIAFINDMNNDLLCVYRCLSSESNYKALIEHLELHQQNHSEKYFKKVRSEDQDSEFPHRGVFVKAARMIYLNKACFNGLYRVNSSGYFNVPSGKKKNVNCFDKENLDNLHEYFMNSDITITKGDYSKAVKTAKEGDFVYFDPPYDDWETKKSFKDYTPKPFGWNEQLKLAACFKELSERGVFVMLSNNNTQRIRELYKDFNIQIVPARRMINSKYHKCGTVEEVIIKNY